MSTLAWIILALLGLATVAVIFLVASPARRFVIRQMVRTRSVRVYDSAVTQAQFDAYVPIQTQLSPALQIERLVDLRDRGVITEAEFQTFKNKAVLDASASTTIAKGAEAKTTEPETAPPSTGPEPETAPPGAYKAAFALAVVIMVIAISVVVLGLSAITILSKSTSDDRAAAWAGLSAVCGFWFGVGATVFAS